jgi:2-iminobutanoate/2-iminopropanoate deaminase
MSQRVKVHSDQAPKAIGPYSQAILAGPGKLLFCSGQIPLDPKTGEMVGASDVRAQARQVMANLGAVLEAGGASFASVVKTTIYLADLADFGAVNEIYGGFFQEAPPARATVQVAGLPKGSLVEIDAVALV